VATRVLSDAELEQLASWPSEVAHSDLVAHFTVSVEDLRWLRSFRFSAAVRLGMTVQLVTSAGTADRSTGTKPRKRSAHPTAWRRRSACPR